MPNIVKYIFLAFCGISMILGFFALSEHPHFAWEKLPVFDALFGFIGCLVIVFISKAIGHYWLQKDEDYYD